MTPQERQLLAAILANKQKYPQTFADPAGQIAPPLDETEGNTGWFGMPSVWQQMQMADAASASAPDTMSRFRALYEHPAMTGFGVGDVGLAGTIKGVTAPNANLKALDLAKKLLKRGGRSRSEVRQQTGWYPIGPGANDWVEELPYVDWMKGAQGPFQSKTGKVEPHLPPQTEDVWTGELMQFIKPTDAMHLYAAYPELGRHKVKFKVNYGPGIEAQTTPSKRPVWTGATDDYLQLGGYFDPETQFINIEAMHPDRQKAIEALFGTALPHEVTHGMQERFDLPRGASSGLIKTITGHDPKIMKSMYDTVDPLTAYGQTLGEWQARQMQNRAGLSNEGKAALSPWLVRNDFPEAATVGHRIPKDWWGKGPLRPKLPKAHWFRTGDWLATLPENQGKQLDFFLAEATRSGKKGKK